jgi:ketosteroid isomerase-like protein
MSEENAELVRRCFDLFLSRNLDELERLLHADAVLDLSRRVFNPQVYRGFGGLRRFVEETDEAWDAFHPELDELIDSGDMVVAAARIGGTGRGSGVPTEMRVFQIWEIRDGKVARLTSGYLDRAEALRDAGISD